LNEPTTAPDYFARARRRSKRSGARPSSRADRPHKPYAAAVPNRYAELGRLTPLVQPIIAGSPLDAAPLPAKKRARAAEPQRVVAPDVAAGTEHALPPTVALTEEFDRVRTGQQARQQRIGRFSLRRPTHPVRTAILSVFLVVAIVAAALLGPLVYRGTRAYHDIFQDPVPHADAPFVAQVNPEGTSVIVPASLTPTAAVGASSGATTSGPRQGADIPEWNGKDRVTILLLGVDRRADEASRSDTMILVNIDPVAKTASMLSIPRDLKVVIPGYGVHKINSAYAYGDADKVPGGGPGLTIRTVEANFGIVVNYYAQVDFQGFTKIIDTIGGLTLDVPYPIKDDEYPGPGNQYMRIYFQTGWQHMNGEQVLEYARTRHDDGDGRRSARQQQVLLALRDQAVNRNLLSKATQLLADFGSAVRTDLQPGQALQLARLGTEIDPAAITQYSLDDALTDQQLPDQPYFLIADWDKVGDIMTGFMGKPVLPPMSALAHSNYAIEIQIQDGTLSPGLGDRVRDVLKANGFANVTVTDLPDLGNHPTSSITTDTNNLTTAVLVANLLGIDLADVSVSDSVALTPTVSPPAVTSTAGATSAAASPQIDSVPLFPTPTGKAGAATTVANQPPARIVLVIGDDAPDPANYSSDPYADDSGQ
jgi:LCP family protein required for cell wall assembly